jgi:hypothetical protein
MTEAKYDVPLDTEYSSQHEEEHEGLLNGETDKNKPQKYGQSADKALEHDVSLEAQKERSKLNGSDLENI